MSREHVTYLQGVYEAYGRGDIPAVLAAMDTDLEWDEPQAPDYPFGGVHLGPQGVANEIFGLYSTYFLEFEAVPQEFIDAGERVIVLGEFQGKGKASGTRFRVPFVHIATFRDGKWVRFQDYTDTGTIAAATR